MALSSRDRQTSLSGPPYISFIHSLWDLSEIPYFKTRHNRGSTILLPLKLESIASVNNWMDIIVHFSLHLPCRFKFIWSYWVWKALESWTFLKIKKYTCVLITNSDQMWLFFWPIRLWTQPSEFAVFTSEFRKKKSF